MSELRVHATQIYIKEGGGGGGVCMQVDMQKCEKGGDRGRMEGGKVKRKEGGLGWLRFGLK